MKPEDFHRTIARAAYEADRKDWQKQGVDCPAWDDANSDEKVFYLHRTAIPIRATIEEVASYLEREGRLNEAGIVRGIIAPQQEKTE